MTSGCFVVTSFLFKTHFGVLVSHLGVDAAKPALAYFF